MKKYLFLLLAFIFIPFSYSDAGIMIMRTRGGGECDDCSGDLKFAWHFENDLTITNGTPCGCVDSSGDDTASVSNDATFSGSQYSDGDYSGYYVSASSDYHYFTIGAGAARDILDDSEGKIVVDIYIDSWVSTAIWIAACYSSNCANDHIRLIMSGSSASDIEITGRYEGNNTTQQCSTSGTGHTEDEWLRVTYAWKISASNADHWVQICDLTPPDTTSNCADSGSAEDDLTAWTGAPDILYIGSYSAEGHTIFIDNIKIYATSGL